MYSILKHLFFLPIPTTILITIKAFFATPSRRLIRRIVLIVTIFKISILLQKAQGRRAGSMRSRGSISGCVAPRVVMYAAPNLFPLNRNLAEKYVINADNPIGMLCQFSSPMLNS